MDNEELFFLPLRQLKQCLDLYDLESVVHEYDIVGFDDTRASIFTVMKRERLQKEEIVERAETTPTTTTNSRRS